MSTFESIYGVCVFTTIALFVIAGVASGILNSTDVLEAKLAAVNIAFEQSLRVATTTLCAGDYKVVDSKVGKSCYCKAVRIAIQQANRAYRSILLREYLAYQGCGWLKTDDAYAELHNAEAALNAHDCTCAAVEVARAFETYAERMPVTALDAADD